MLAEVLLLYARAVLARDLSLFDKPDYGDRQLALNDRPFDPAAYAERDAPDSEELRARETRERLEEQRNKLAKHLKSDVISPLTDQSLWKKLRDFLLKQWEVPDFKGQVSVSFLVRYNFCVFLFIQLPAEVAFPFPALYSWMIPARLRTIPVISTFIEKLEVFCKFIKKRSKKQLLINIKLSRKFDSRKDLDFLLEIPKLISTDPAKIVSWLIQIDLKAGGLSFERQALPGRASKVGMPYLQRCLSYFHFIVDLSRFLRISALLRYYHHCNINIVGPTPEMVSKSTSNNYHSSLRYYHCCDNIILCCDINILCCDINILCGGRGG